MPAKNLFFGYKIGIETSENDKKLTKRTNMLKSPKHLTRKELKLLDYICENHSNEMIAKLLGISLAIVNLRVAGIMEKLEVTSRKDLIELIVKNKQ